MLKATISFRPIGTDDQAFLYEVYAGTRRDELAAIDWDDNQKAAFLRMQFSSQQQYYQEHYADADFLIVLLGSQAIGRLYIARWPNEIRIVDLALAPVHRNAGIGAKILVNIMAEAAETGQPVTLHVERFNRASGLYRRLGFAKKGEHGVYDLMEWRKTP